MRIAIFTRTMWDEPPRLRKQVAEMLLARGHEVHFFQKRKFMRKPQTVNESPNLWLHTGGHLLHHQLKIVPLLNKIDAYYLKRIIRQQFQPKPSDIVINFCYDFFFLRDLFPENPIIHVVNDDYIAAAIAPHRRSAKTLLHQTARSANHNLVVSYLIEKQIAAATNRVSLFFPWARHEYERPPESAERAEVLYWGYINERINETIVQSIMDAGIRINFVGLITPSKRTDRILAHKNATVLDPKPLQEIPEILSRCCCAIIPYDMTNPYNPAITISNRGFELLSFGLPLIFSDLPNLIQAPSDIIHRCQNADQFIATISKTRQNFYGIQTKISDFLVGHTADFRYDQLMNTIQDARQDSNST